jgi:hypothetical protein
LPVIIWMNLSWQNGERVTGVAVYVRIRDEDIVLAFHDPKMRKRTGFAAAL